MTKREAQKLGKALIGRLEGKGWELVLHENEGWHYRARLGHLDVHEVFFQGQSTYHCLMSIGPVATGWGEIFWSGEGDRFSKDPNKVVQAQLKRAKSTSSFAKRLSIR